MSEEKSLQARLRTEDFGSAGSRRLIRKGEIPAVVYGKQEPIHIVINAKEFMMKKHTFSESTLISLNVDGTEHKVFVKTYQEDLLKGIVKHVDFYEVTFGVLVKTHVRVELTGTPFGCKAGGVLDQVIHEIEIECFPRHLPQAITADVTNLQINEGIRVSDLNVPAEIKVLSDLNATVATVKGVKEDAAPAADAAAATEEAPAK
ncbi:MAG: 50S ribosomal protein L25 [Bullifex sp.]